MTPLHAFLYPADKYINMKTQKKIKPESILGEVKITPVYEICSVETDEMTREIVDELKISDLLVTLLPTFNKHGYIIRPYVRGRK
jgi:hypothetical protein